MTNDVAEGRVRKVIATSRRTRWAPLPLSNESQFDCVFGWTGGHAWYVTRANQMAFPQTITYKLLLSNYPLGKMSVLFHYLLLQQRQVATSNSESASLTLQRPLARAFPLPVEFGKVQWMATLTTLTRQYNPFLSPFLLLFVLHHHISFFF